MNNTYKHIVLISLDTLRRDCITHAWKSEFVREYGSPNFNTTSLNTIIQKWTFFNNCITAAPYTTASHGAYFTWVWPIKNNVYEFFNKKINKETIFEHFKNFWYDTYFHTDFEVILWPYLWITNLNPLYHFSIFEVFITHTDSIRLNLLVMTIKKK